MDMWALPVGRTSFVPYPGGAAGARPLAGRLSSCRYSVELIWLQAVHSHDGEAPETLTVSTLGWGEATIGGFCVNVMRAPWQ
jgi:hypothetical protein